MVEGTPKFLEHKDVKWFIRQELDEINLIPAYIKAVKYLNKLG